MLIIRFIIDLQALALHFTACSYKLRPYSINSLLTAQFLQSATTKKLMPVWSASQTALAMCFWQRKIKRGTLPRPTVKAYGAAMCLHNLFHNGQSQAGASKAARPRFIYLMKALPDLLLLFFRNPGPCVCNTNTYLLIDILR